MSGYASRREAEQIVRATIEHNKVDLPTDVKSYVMARIYVDTIRSRGLGYGWSIEPSESLFWLACIDALRPDVELAPWAGHSTTPVTLDELQRVIEEDAR